MSVGGSDCQFVYGSLTPVGKLADAELHFDGRDGQLLDGLKLTGFAVWEGQWPTKYPRHPHTRVTMPARPYESVSGERRSFNLLRPVQVWKATQEQPTASKPVPSLDPSLALRSE